MGWREEQQSCNGREGARSAPFCLMQGRQSTVKNGWGGRGAQRKGPKIGKGMSHEILNTVKNNGEDGARSAKAQILYCKGTVTRNSKHC
jgi:hypothetical protein